MTDDPKAIAVEITATIDLHGLAGYFQEQRMAEVMRIESRIESALRAYGQACAGAMRERAASVCDDYLYSLDETGVPSRKWNRENKGKDAGEVIRQLPLEG